MIITLLIITHEPPSTAYRQAGWLSHLSQGPTVGGLCHRRKEFAVIQRPGSTINLCLPEAGTQTEPPRIQRPKAMAGDKSCLLFHLVAVRASQHHDFSMTVEASSPQILKLWQSTLGPRWARNPKTLHPNRARLPKYRVHAKRTLQSLKPNKP